MTNEAYGPRTPRTHGSIELDWAACTACDLCAVECPAWCISLSAHNEAVSDDTSRRPRTTKVLDGFTIDFGLCMYCGICVQVCPFDALAWSPTPVATDALAVTWTAPLTPGGSDDQR